MQNFAQSDILVEFGAQQLFVYLHIAKNRIIWNNECLRVLATTVIIAEWIINNKNIHGSYQSICKIVQNHCAFRLGYYTHRLQINTTSINFLRVDKSIKCNTIRLKWLSNNEKTPYTFQIVPIVANFRTIKNNFNFIIHFVDSNNKITRFNN